MFAASMTDLVDLVSPLWRQREANMAAEQQNRSGMEAQPGLNL
jgi:hypothetical protein